LCSYLYIANPASPLILALWTALAAGRLEAKGEIAMCTKTKTAAALLFVAVFAAHAQTPVSGEAADAYHFKYWEGSPLNAAYNEWWYFNVYDAKDGLHAFFTYQVADPLNLTGEGGGDLTAVVYQGSNIVTESDLYPLSAFSASYSAADVTLGANTISVSSPDTYLVSGATVDGRLSWNLRYDRDAASWFADNRINVAPAAWEEMSWLIYMPRAGVTGTLTLDGRTYNIACSGYHDHNWGQWNFETVRWNWAQFSLPGVTFDLGDIVGNPNGTASVDIAGQRTVFSAGQYTLTHTKWAFDSADNIPYPVESTFTAQNGDVAVSLVMDAQSTDPLATGPAPSLVIYEQPTHFTGTITQGQNTTTFAVDGFVEYTAISKPSSN
jgi:hypothetical protein